MTLEPLFSASTEIQVHVAFAVIALLIGPVALFRKRRDRLHKISGYTWVAGITGLSVSGIFIPSEIAVIGQFGPIHLFSLFALWGVGAGMYWVWKGDIARHRAAMRSVWFGTMGLALLLQLLPGRVMNRMIFGEPSELGYLCIAIGGVWLFFGGRRQRQDQHPLN